MSLTTGEIIEGKYRIVRLIGEGGMGAVYEGENTRIHRRVAIKVLHAGVAENQEAVQRFEREAQAAGRIGNDHILEVIDMGSLSNGDHFMVMEFLDGEPLAERIRRVGRMRPEEVASLVVQALEGLRAAHDSGIVHRDLKPDNIFVLREKAGTKDFVKLIDFGISKFSSLTGGSEMKMTRTGTVMGTPYYMSPEQASGSREADHRSDLYAIGVILYEAVTGRVPFDAGTFNQLLFQIVLSDPAPPQQVVPDLDPGFANLIAKAMARDVEHRFQTAADMALALNAWLKSGATVSVAPPAAMNPLVQRAQQVSQPLIDLPHGTQPLVKGATTPDVWAQSQPLEPDGLPKSKSPVLVLAAIGVLVLGGIGFGAFKLLGTGSVPPTVASAPTTVDNAVAAKSPEGHVNAQTNAQTASPTVVPVESASVVATASAAPSAVTATPKPNPLPVANAGAKGNPHPNAAAVKPPVKDKPTAAGTRPAQPSGARPARPSGGPVDFGY